MLGVLKLAQPDSQVELRAVKGGKLIGLIGVIIALLLLAAWHWALRLEVVSRWSSPMGRNQSTLGPRVEVLPSRAQQWAAQERQATDLPRCRVIDLENEYERNN